MTPLPHRLDRTIVIQAAREIVFRYFTDTERWAAWWGAGSTIDARPGGRVLIRYPGGVDATGEVVEAVPPERIVFTYGYASGAPIPPGSSRVTIHLEAHGLATRLRFAHEFADAAVRDEHVQGWRYQLSLFANVVTDHVHSRADVIADAWFALWAEPDSAARRHSLAAIATPDVRFRDRVSCIDGADELVEHIGAAQRFMPGLRLERRGHVRHCQGVALSDWTAVGPNGEPRGTGTNVFVIGPDQRIESTTGFWAPPAA